MKSPRQKVFDFLTTMLPFGLLRTGLPKQFIVYGHLVGPPDHPVADYYRYPTLEEFDRFIIQFTRQGYSFVSLEDFLKSDQKKKILLTFDDGFKMVRDVLHPYLMTKCIPYVLFVLTDPLDNPGFHISTVKPKHDSAPLFLTAEEILQLKAQGVHIGFHTRSHHRVDSRDQLTDSFVADQLTIPEKYADLFSKPLCFAYPYYAPDNFESFNRFMHDKLGYQFFFDTKGFSGPQGNHFFRVSIDVEKAWNRSNGILFVVKRQLLLFIKKKFIA